MNAIELAEKLKRYKLVSGYAWYCHKAAAMLHEQHTLIENLQKALREVPNAQLQYADHIRRQHEAIVKLREALESICEGDSQAITEAEALGIPFPDEMLTEYRKAQQALKDTEEFK